jgi:hypothetical protein
VEKIDWTGTPLEAFLDGIEEQEDGTARYVRYPLGDGEAQMIMVGLFASISNAYNKLTLEENERFESAGEVLLIRNGQRTYERLDDLTLRDLPAVLDGLAVLEEEYRQKSRRVRAQSYRTQGAGESTP